MGSDEGLCVDSRNEVLVSDAGGGQRTDVPSSRGLLPDTLFLIYISALRRNRLHAQCIVPTERSLEFGALGFD